MDGGVDGNGGIGVDGSGASAAPRLRMHTVFDRTLLRAGETVAMKHLVRADVAAGLRDADKAALPTHMKILHIGSVDEIEQALTFDAAGRAALSSRDIPANPKLGLHEAQLCNSQRESARSGVFRVEEFRLPLVDARLTAPKATQVAPSSLAMALRLTHPSDGGLVRAPLVPRRRGFGT